jgi:hypothetical protein
LCVGPLALLLIFAASLGLGACAGDSATDDAGGGAGGTPVRGGTLELIGNSDVDHLSTTSAYYSVTNIVLRGFARQLVTFPPEPSFAAQTQLAPDLARELPTRANGGISADGLTYVSSTSERDVGHPARARGHRGRHCSRLQDALQSGEPGGARLATTTRRSSGCRSGVTRSPGWRARSRRSRST